MRGACHQRKRSRPGEILTVQLRAKTAALPRKRALVVDVSEPATQRLVETINVRLLQHP